AAKRITHHGLLAHSRLLELYREADIFVFPSLWDEPFGMPIVEAMACARPVVATRGGGIHELVSHGHTGLLVPKGDVAALATALLRLLDDADARARLGAAA